MMVRTVACHGCSRAGKSALALALLVLPALAHAQTPLALTLEDAIARGKANAPRLLEVQAREAAAEATRDGRAALDRPTLGVTSGYLRTNHVDAYGIRQPDGSTRIIFPDIPDNFRLRTELQWPVWTSGRVRALVDSAAAEVRATEAEADVVAADLTLEITQAYWMLVTSRETLKVIDEGLARTDAWVADVQARLDAGLVSPHEVLTARARRAREQVQRIQAANAAANAERELARLLGMPGQAIDPVSPVDRPLDGVAGLMARPAQEVVALAREQRAERETFMQRQASLQSAVTASEAASRPQVAAIAAVEPARPNNRFVPRENVWHTSWDLGVSMTWSLWDSGRAKADRAQAEAQARALDQRLAEFDARVSVDVQRQLQDVEAGSAAIAAADEAVAASAEAHRVLRERYVAGVATSTDVLDAQVALLEAELERTRLQAALRISEARLRRAVGME